MPIDIRSFLGKASPDNGGSGSVRSNSGGAPSRHAVPTQDAIPTARAARRDAKSRRRPVVRHAVVSFSPGVNWQFGCQRGIVRSYGSPLRLERFPIMLTQSVHFRGDGPAGARRTGRPPKVNPAQVGCFRLGLVLNERTGKHPGSRGRGLSRRCCVGWLANRVFPVCASSAEVGNSRLRTRVPDTAVIVSQLVV